MTDPSGSARSSGRLSPSRIRSTGREATGHVGWDRRLHGSVHVNLAAANGWMARAASLLEDVEPCGLDTRGIRSGIGDPTDAGRPHAKRSSGM